MRLIQSVFVWLTFLAIFNKSNGLRILFVLPCYGGHFGSMAPLIVPLSANNNVTVLETSSKCQPKLAPYRQKASFNVIEENFVEESSQLKGFLNVLWMLFHDGPKVTQQMFAFMKKFLLANRNEYDVMIGDITQVGVLVAAEVADIPTVVINTGYSGPVEELVDKIGAHISEVILMKLVLKIHRSQLDGIRKDHGLPEIISNGDFCPNEYMARFPALIVTSPDFYPEAHPSASFIFIGAAQNEGLSELDDNLQNWLDQDDITVIYLSLGTVFTISDDAVIQNFVTNIRNQNNYRIVWSLSRDLQSAVERLELQSDSKIYFSGYLPQYTLLGHEKVKVFVTHGGLGSTIDLIKRRKPAVCSPQLFDQFYNCRKLESLQIAEYISSFDFESINTSIAKVLESYDNYVSNADLIAKSFTRYESTEAIEEFLEKVASKGSIDVIKEFEFNFCSEKCYNAWMLMKICLFTGILMLFILTLLILKRCFMRPKKNDLKPKRS